ncbi:hypothetical protein KR054_006496 [Drosophila jambulina]|nr:hypothetical protein KR054_006496 [Drosophila jambulina]
MDKHNIYRSELREHFCGTRNVPKRDKNGHRIPLDDDRHRLQYVENTNQFSTHTFIREPRDHSEEYLKCPSGKCLHGQYDSRGHRAAPDPAPDYQYHQHSHQNQCHHNTRKPNHNTRNNYRNAEPDLEKTEGAGDYVVYRNPGYREATSDRIEEERQETVPINDYNHKHHQSKDRPHKDYEKARAHCAASGEIFRHKYSFLSDDSSTSKKSKPSQNTIISAKSGKDIRSLIRSQIHLQQALDHSLTEVERRTPPREVLHPHLGDDKRESDKGVSGLEKETSPTPNKLPKTPKKLPEIEGFEDVDLDKLSPIDVTTMFNVSADDIVHSKVIEPMIRKIQYMYLNTLREEMSVMQYLGRVPKMISEVYREVALRDNRKSSDIK